MHRTTRYLAAEAGVRQFLDIGSGIPTSPNLHEIAQGVVPDARVVYVDNDPIVLAHARALLTGTAQGRTAYLEADLRQPARILGSAELAATLDLSEPVALSLIAIFHFVADEDDPYGLVRTYLDVLPSGSYLTVSQFTADLAPEEAARAAAVYHCSVLPAVARSREQIARFFDGLELVDPGVELVHRWRPDSIAEDGPSDAQVSVYGAVARKP